MAQGTYFFTAESKLHFRSICKWCINMPTRIELLAPFGGIGLRWVIHNHKRTPEYDAYFTLFIVSILTFWNVLDLSHNFKLLFGSYSWVLTETLTKFKENAQSKCNCANLKWNQDDLGLGLYRTLASWFPLDLFTQVVLDMQFFPGHKYFFQARSKSRKTPWYLRSYDFDEWAEIDHLGCIWI